MVTRTRHSVTLYVYCLSFYEIRWKGVDWISVAQDKNKWQAVVKRVMNLWVP